jgi:hypothetical protein
MTAIPDPRQPACDEARISRAPQSLTRAVDRVHFGTASFGADPHAGGRRTILVNRSVGDVSRDTWSVPRQRASVMVSDNSTAEHTRLEADRIGETTTARRENDEQQPGTTDEHRVKAESAQHEAEQLRRCAEEARDEREQRGEALEQIRHDGEDLRNSMETARLTAEHARDATVAAMRASTDALDASVEPSSVVDDMPQLRDYQALREPD